MAIVCFNGDKFQRAKAEVGDADLEKLIAKYKEFGGTYLEGSNEEVYAQPGYIRFMDKPKKEKPEEKPEEKPKKPAAKKGKKKKK